MVRLIARLDLPLGFGESEAFDDYITTAHNPRFTPCSRQTKTRDLTKYFTKRRDKLMDTLKIVSSVALTLISGLVMSRKIICLLLLISLILIGN